MTCSPPPGKSTSSTSRTKPRPSYEACRTSGGTIRHESVSNDALDQMPQRHDDSLDLPSTLAKAIKPSTRPTRARPQKVYKATVLVALETFHSIITCIWEKEAIPLEF
ncbi:hypothetical protein RRG08_059850 [Elysia crispata]|uniref:Uncharacterized protein n=1 Tax=Elysia crispata TaxID=231223 RepID=A0AAE0XZ06_9GAST|nr:hypothetical protein RRG08_059850 [Elysia crispata]